MSRIVTSVCISVVLGLFINGCGYFGPSDKPKFENMKWKRVQISYWVLERPNARVKRTFAIEDDRLVIELHKSMAIHSIGPNSLGNDDRFVITLENNEIWDCGFVFEDRFDMCKRENAYFSYTLTMGNTAFYERALHLCLENERKTTPAATELNIILRTNKTNEAFQVLPAR